MYAETKTHDASYTGSNSLAARLAALQPKKRTSNQAKFAEHYEEILHAIERGVSLKDIREALAEAGLKLSSATFKRLLQAEADRRRKSSPQVSEAGEQGGAA
ncbi:hypothetical protein ISP17_02810 [Dyella ginsengisoli]|uniref:Uncharacterized protein n=1 Tax=Dyella ginsengisoli TaxID=363848 RepID=A0ABW8JP30_9GAMM